MTDLHDSEAKGGRPVVLIVDDEPDVRGILERSLAEDGYELLLAASADEAMAFLEPAPRRLNLAVIDVSLPGADGPALAGRLRRSTPGLPVLFISGYGERAEVREPLLAKPFNPDDLARCVRQMLATGQCEGCAPTTTDRQTAT